jgi:hypothetical protein
MCQSLRLRDRQLAHHRRPWPGRCRRGHAVHTEAGGADGAARGAPLRGDHPARRPQREYLLGCPSGRRQPGPMGEGSADRLQRPCEVRAHQDHPGRPHGTGPGCAHRLGQLFDPLHQGQRGEHPGDPRGKEPRREAPLAAPRQRPRLGLRPQLLRPSAGSPTSISRSTTGSSCTSSSVPGHRSERSYYREGAWQALQRKIFSGRG